MGLTDKQIRFCHEYLIDLNSTQAALRAGYSKTTAEKKAQLWVGKSRDSSQYPEMFDFVDKRRRKISEKLEITQERVLQEYARVAFFDIRNIYTETNSLKNVKDLDDASAAAIAGIEVTEESAFIDGLKVNLGFTKKIKIHNKITALEGIGRHLGMFNDKLKVDVSEELMNLYKTVMSKRANP